MDKKRLRKLTDFYKPYRDSDCRAIAYCVGTTYGAQYLSAILDVNVTKEILCPFCFEAKMRWHNYSAAKENEGEVMSAKCDGCKEVCYDSELLVGEINSKPKGEKRWQAKKKVTVVGNALDIKRP